MHLVLGREQPHSRVAGVRTHRCPLTISGAGQVLRVEAPVELEEPVHVVGPGLYLLMRATLAMPQLLPAIALNLCGTYEVHPENGTCLFDRPPLTDPESLAAFARKLPSGCTGRSHLQDALALCTGRSRSPMETALALMLSLKRRDGGWELPAPQLNRRVDLGPDAARALGGQAHVFIDLLWPEASIGIEYDSREHHSERDRQLHDKRRQVACSLCGIEIVPWTPAIVNDEVTFGLACQWLANRLEAPFSWDTDHVEKRRWLRRALLGPHRFW